MKPLLTRLLPLLLLGCALEARALDTGFPYQGRLFTNGVAANGVFDLQFQLFTAANGGAAVRAATLEDQGVTNGFFSVRVDFGAGAFDGTDLWLETAVREGTSTGAFESLGARRPLLPVPFAQYTHSAGNLIGNAATQLAATNAALVTQLLSASNSLGTALVATNNLLTLNLMGVSNQFAASLTASSNASAAALAATNVALVGQLLSASNSLRTALVATNDLLILRVEGVSNQLAASVSTLTTALGTASNTLSAGLVSLSNSSSTALMATNTALVARFSAENLAMSNQFTVTTAALATQQTAASNALAAALVATNTALATAIVTATNQAVTNLLAGANTFTANQTVAGVVAADAVSGRGTAALELKVDGTRALRLEPSATGPNVIGGHADNTVTNGFSGAVIAGGGTAAKPQRIGANHATIGGGQGNTSRADYAVVGGGQNNLAGGSAAVVGGGEDNTASGSLGVVAGGAANTAAGLLAVVGGGQNNLASANYATVIGGDGNAASGSYATVLGGAANLANASYAVAAGRRAQATNAGAFVLADSVNADFRSSRTNEFAARATGGVRFVSAVDGSGTPVAGVSLAPTATAWSIISDREAKKDFAPVDTRAVLEKLAGVPVQTWHYRWEDSQGTPHLGPVAQDFKAAFFPGRDERSITTLEFDGVALAAIQGLNRKLEAEVKTKDAELAELRRSVAELRQLLERAVGTSERGGAR